MNLSAILSGAAAAILTPLIMALWSKMAPPAESSDFDHIDPVSLHDRNNGFDIVCQVLSLAGIFTPVVLMAIGVTPSFWLVGFGFGLMVILPVAFIVAVTLRDGIQRYREFWRFYELKWKVGIRSVAWLYTPLALLGVISFLALMIGF